jgi:hypothetical protein
MVTLVRKHPPALQPVEVAQAGARMSKMATHHLGITPASGLASFLHLQNSDKEPSEYLAILSYFHKYVFSPILGDCRGRGKHYRSTGTA